MTLERQGETSFFYHIVFSLKYFSFWTFYNHPIKYPFHKERIAQAILKKEEKFDAGIPHEWQII